MKRLITRIATWLIQGILGLVLIAFFLFLFVEWVSGCGEAYTDSKGKVHINECVHRTVYKHLNQT